MNRRNIARNILADFFREHRKEVSNMILNELTNADAIEAVREETWEATWNEAWEKASEATWEEAQKRIIALVQKGLTGAQLEQAIRSERPYVVPQTTKEESSKR